MQTVEAVAAAATELARAGVPSAVAALVALIDSAEPMTAGEVLALASDDREEIEDAIAVARAAGLVVDTPAGLALDADARRALRGLPPELAPHGAVVRGGDRGGAIAERIAQSAVVVAGGSPAAAIAELPGAVYSLAPSAPAGVLRDAWLRGAACVVDARSAALDGIDAFARVPVPLAIAVSAAHAGEALARLRRYRDAWLWQPDAPAPGPTTPLPKELWPLFSTSWNGIRVGGPSVRVAALRGSADAIAEAAQAAAGALGVALHVANARSLSEIADALASPVVLVRGLAAADPLAAHAAATALDRATGLVLLEGAPVPPFAAEMEIDV